MDVTITVSTSFSWIMCSNSSLCAADSGTVGQGRRGRGRAGGAAVRAAA